MRFLVALSGGAPSARARRAVGPGRLMTCGLERAVKCSWARVKGDRVWLDEVSVARCAHESFLVGLRVIGSESSNELLRTDEGERERRSIGSGRVGKTGDGGEDEVEVGADEKDEASVELQIGRAHV